MTTDKKPVALLAEILVRCGLEYLVHSPGSRNAPIIIAFSKQIKVKTETVTDERSAAFFALGIAIKTGKTVAIDCTSGSAALNYAPAIAEAYYQQIPLLVLTADRSPMHIDIGDGQTIRQDNLYANYIKKSFTLPTAITSPTTINEAAKLVHEAYALSMQAPRGPVHINIPLDEPLYNLANFSIAEEILNQKVDIEVTPAPIPGEFLYQWKDSEKIMIIAGQSDPQPDIEAILGRLADNNSLTILTETTSNLYHPNFIDTIDSTIATIKHEEIGQFTPDLLITFGGAIVSKMIKAFLRKNQPKNHWHISPDGKPLNTYFCLTGSLKGDPAQLLNELSKNSTSGESNFERLWLEKKKSAEMTRISFLREADFSDFKVFENILNQLPADCNLHLGNSTPVRYSQLFGSAPHLVYYSNRGVSGIDGQISTAVGVSMVSKKANVLITGDLGFVYDSNGLMLLNNGRNLKIIVINNHGGGIFRFIAGPDTVEGFETYFEARHALNMELLARAFQLDYFKAETQSQVFSGLEALFSSSDKPAVLEIVTPSVKNADILRSYFVQLKNV